MNLSVDSSTDQSKKLFPRNTIHHGTFCDMLQHYTLPHIDMTYTDPPWGQGNLTMWSNKAGIQWQEWLSFLHELVSVIKVTQGPIYVEMGKHWLQDLISEVNAQQGKVLMIWPITYYRTRPTNLLLCSWRGLIADTTFDFGGMDDDETPLHAIRVSSKKNSLIFDPCIGTGLTARAAITQGRDIIGCELNAQRHKLAVQVMNECLRNRNEQETR